MSQNYKRVLPRDLFNEAKLLKCMGKLTLLIEDKMIDNLIYHYDLEPFCACQNEADGSIYMGNIEVFRTGSEGGKIELSTPLNSKEPWPLRALIGDEEFSVFDDEGNIADEFTIAIAYN